MFRLYKTIRKRTVETDENFICNVHLEGFWVTAPPMVIVWQIYFEKTLLVTNLSGDTVTTQWRHSDDTVATQWQHSGDTETHTCRYYENLKTSAGLPARRNNRPKQGMQPKGRIYWSDMTHIKRNNVLNFIFQYISNKMQRHTVYLYLETALRVSGGTSTHHQERIQLYLQYLVFITLLLVPAAIVEELELIAAGSSNGVTSIRCCRYSCIRSW